MARDSAANFLKVGINTLENLGRTTPGPYAAGVLTGAKFVVDTVLNGNENDPNSQSLAGRVLEISNSCLAALPKEGIPQDFQTTYYVGKLMHVLNRIAKKLVSQRQRGRVTKLVLKSRDATTLKELGDNLESCAAILSLHLQMDSLRLSNRLTAAERQRESDVQRAIAKAQKEELDLINSHFLTRTNQTISKSFLPPAPHIFHGRSEEVDRISQTLLKDEASYVCILGPGRVGKTSLGLSILHHPQIVKTYHWYRYFVPCDSMSDAPTLLTTLASLFRVAEKQFWLQFPELCRSLKRKILLMMDNFETPWESITSRKDVETIISKLADIPNLSIVLTLRGSERPYGIPWTRPFMSPLRTLDMPPAKQMFLEISDVPESAEGLEELLSAVDMLPLAVTLLANQAQVTTCSNLLQQWNAKKTSMVTRGIQDRISSLDVSIQISLSSPRLSNCPGALSLLQILSVLPDGGDAAGLNQMAPEDLDTIAATAVLNRVGLAYRNEAGRLHSLAPVREHLRAYLPMNLDLLCRIAAFHNSLAEYAKDQFLWEDDRRLMIESVTPQIGNMHSVLAFGLEKTELQKDAITAINDVHYFHRAANFGPNQKLLEAALDASRSRADAVLEGDCLLATHVFDPKDRAKTYLDGILQVYRSLGDSFRISRCLLAIASVYLHDDAAKAVDAATEVIDHLQAVTPMRDVALAYNVIIHQSRADGDLRKAWSMARTGLGIPGLSGMAKANLLHSIAILHGFAGQLSASLECEIQSAGIMDHLGDSRSYLPHESIGQVYFMQSRLTLAAAVFDRLASITESTRSLYHTTAGPYFAARIALLRGDVPLALAKCQALHSLCFKGERYNVTTQRPIVLRYLSSALAEIEMSAHNWAAAAIHIQSTHECEAKLRWVSRYNEVETLFRHADLLTAMGQASESLNPSITALILCFRQGDPFGLSMALQRVGDVFYFDEQWTHAQHCYGAELLMLEEADLNMGASRHIGDCLLRLGMISLKRCTLHDARTSFERAEACYKDAEYGDGVEFCKARLAESPNREILANSDDLPLLPLGNRLFCN